MPRLRFPPGQIFEYRFIAPSEFDGETDVEILPVVETGIPGVFMVDAIQRRLVESIISSDADTNASGQILVRRVSEIRLPKSA